VGHLAVRFPGLEKICSWEWSWGLDEHIRLVLKTKYAGVATRVGNKILSTEPYCRQLFAKIVLLPTDEYQRYKINCLFKI
jgi:hypothetical protein